MSTEQHHTPTTIRLRKDITRRLRKLAKKHHVGASTLIRQAIAEKIADWEKAGVVVLQIN